MLCILLSLLSFYVYGTCDRSRTLVPERSVVYIRPDGIYVKSYFLFSLIFLRTTISYLRVVPVPQLLPAPEGTGSAAGARLVSYCKNEICSENERGLMHQNLLPFFGYKTSWDTCQVELYSFSCTSSCCAQHGMPVHYLNENENEVCLWNENEILQPRSRHRATAN